MTMQLALSLSTRELTSIKIHKFMARMLYFSEIIWLAFNASLRLFRINSKTGQLIKTAQIFEIQDEAALAVEYYEKALARSPKLNRLHLALGRCHLRLLNMAKCRDHLTIYLDKKKDDPEASLYLGMALYYLGNPEQALPHLVKAEQTLPDNHKKTACSLEYLGECYRKLGNYELALHYLEEAQKMNPYDQNPHILQSLGELQYALGNKESALSLFQQALRINPNLVDLWNNIGVMLFEDRQLEKAADCFRQAVALKPGYKEGVDHLQLVEEELRRSTVKPTVIPAVRPG